jgi:hypothetical protein
MSRFRCLGTALLQGTYRMHISCSEGQTVATNAYSARIGYQAERIMKQVPAIWESKLSNLVHIVLGRTKLNSRFSMSMNTSSSSGGHESIDRLQAFENIVQPEYIFIRFGKFRPTSSRVFRLSILLWFRQRWSTRNDHGLSTVHYLKFRWCTRNR